MAVNGIPLARAFVRVEADTGGFKRQTERESKAAGKEGGGAFADGFRRRIATALKQLPKVTIGVARNEAEQALKDVRKQLADLSGKQIGIDIDAGGALAEADRLRERLTDLGAASPDIQVRADTAAATAKLAEVAAQARKLAGLEPTIEVDADTGAATAKLAAVGATSLGSLSGMQALIGAGALLGPAIAPAAAAAVAAIAAIGPAALAGVAGLGVLVLGSLGVIEAIQQMSAVQDQAAQSGATMSAQQAAVAAAADQVRNAERSLGNTRAQVADGARRAAQAVTDAQRNLTFAERDALSVRRDLSRAQEEARRAMQDLGSQVRGNALDQRQANLDVADAQRELNRTLADPSATAAQRQQAQLNYERAVLQLQDLQTRGSRLAQEQAASNKAGVEGSEQVRAARDRIASADQRVGDARRALDEAQRARDAQARQGAFQIAQATQAIVAAQRSLETASTRAGVGGTSAMQKLKQAMADLSPVGRTFATFLFGLKDEFLGLRQAAERGLLPGVQAGIQALLPLLPHIQKFIFRIASAMGSLAKRAGEALASPFWVRFFDWLGRIAGPMFNDFGTVIGALAEGFVSLLMAFAPLSKDLVAGLARLATGFARWAASLSGTSAFNEFIAYVRENGPQLVRLLGDFLIVALKLAIALAPLGEILLKGLVKGMAWLAKQDPGVLLGIAAGVAAIVGGLIALAAGPLAAVGAVTIAIVALVGALIYAYKHWEGFRRVVDTVARAYVGYVSGILRISEQVFRGVSAAVTTARQVIQPSLDRLNWLLRNVTGPTLLWLWRNVAVPAWRAIQTAFRVGSALAQVALGIMQIGIKVTAAVFAALYARTIKPVWDRIRPILTALGTIIKTQVAPAFNAGATAIGKAWQRIADLAKVPVRFVISTILNAGIIDNFNRIAKTFGVKTVDRVPLPRGFATGGVLPGYTPGRDPHVFRSATGGTLALSGGEAILRPEATRALGKGWVDGVNSAARNGGVGGVKSALGYADGGIFSTATNLFGAAKRKAGDAIQGAKDIITDPGGTLRRLGTKLIGTLPGRGTAFGHLLTAVPNRIVDFMVDKVSGFFSDRAGRALGGPGSGASPFGGSAGMMRALRSAFPGLRLISGFRPGSTTLSGTTSYHSKDRAVDVPPSRSVAKYIHDKFRAITRELITPFQEYNLWNGRPHTYTGAVWNQHNFAGGNAHDHWAARLGGLIPRLPFGSYDTGGFLPRGLSLAYNGTGAREPVGGGGDTHIHLHNNGVIGSQRELDNWLVRSVDRLKAQRRLP